MKISRSNSTFSESSSMARGDQRSWVFLAAVAWGLLSLLQGNAHAQDVNYSPASAKRHITRSLERMINLTGEHLESFKNHPSSQNIAVPTSLQKFIDENAKRLQKSIDVLNSVEKLPEDTALEHVTRWCELTALSSPVSILEQIGGSRFPPSCGGCSKSKIELSLPPKAACRESYRNAFFHYRELSEPEALALLEKSLATRFSILRSYTIGSVSVDTSERSEKEFEIAQALSDAQNAYMAARETRDLRLQQLEKAQTANAAEVADLRRPVHILEDEIAKLRAKGLKDISDVRTSRSYRHLSDKIASYAKRGDQIDAAVKNLFENYPQSDQFAQERIRALQAEQDEIFTARDKALATREEFALPEITLSDMEEIRALENNLFVLKNDANRRIGLADSKLDSAINLLDAAEEALQPLEAILNEALKKSRDFKLVSGSIFSKLTTDHAVFENTGDIPDIEPLNALIHDLANRRKAERKQMLAARQEWQDALNTVEGRALELRNAGYSSLFRQFLIEVGFSAYDLVSANRRGGLAGVAAEAWTQFFLNLYFGVTYEDAQRGTLAEFKALRAPDNQRKWLEYDSPEDWANRVGGQVGKHLLSMPKETQIAYFESLRGVKVANKSHLRALKAIEQSIAQTGMADIRSLMAPYSASLVEQEKLAKRYADLLGKNGFKASAKATAKGLLGGLAKEMLKELAKEEIAELVEQPAFNRYMNAQVDLSLAFAARKNAADVYWATNHLLTVHRNARDTFLAAFDGLDPQTGWQEIKNEPWLAAAKYGFWLDLTKDGKELARELEINVEMEGIKLIRDETKTEFGWRIPGGMAEKLYDGLPEELSIVIKVR